MKLLEKSNKYFFRFTALLLGVGALGFFLSIYFIIQEEVKENLDANAGRIIQLLSNGRTVNDLPPLIEIVPNYTNNEPDSIFSIITLFDSYESEDELFRQLIRVVNIHNTNYKITVRSPLVEAEDLLIAVGLGLFLLMLLLFFGLRWFNAKYAQKIWKPFYQNLKTIQNYSFKEPQLKLVDSDIDEFNALNSSITFFADKMEKDYQNLKEFTENASHEIQTPLSIIIGKIEFMLQDETVDENQAASLNKIYNSCLRLSKVNRGLLLLTKIENNLFEDKKKVDFVGLIKSQVELFEDFIQDKEQILKLNLVDEKILKAHPILLQVLLKNLIENAIRYTPRKGKININLTADKLVIVNSGETPIPGADKIFERFQKRVGHKNSLGLGLSIAQKIVEQYDWSLEYFWDIGQHHFILDFK